MSERACNTCKHIVRFAYEEPCKSCTGYEEGYSNWEEGNQEIVSLRAQLADAKAEIERLKTELDCWKITPTESVKLLIERKQRSFAFEDENKELRERAEKAEADELRERLRQYEIVNQINNDCINGIVDAVTGKAVTP